MNALGWILLISAIRATLADFAKWHQLSVARSESGFTRLSHKVSTANKASIVTYLKDNAWTLLGSRLDTAQTPLGHNLKPTWSPWLGRRWTAQAGHATLDTTVFQCTAEIPNK